MKPSIEFLQNQKTQIEENLRYARAQKDADGVTELVFMLRDINAEIKQFYPAAQGIPATMYHIFDKLALLLVVGVLLSGVGCKSLQRLPGLESPHETPNPNAINPNDFYVTGTTTKDYQSVYLNISSRTITVEVMRPTENAWRTLERPDVYDYFDSYQLFTIPTQGVHFGKLAYHNSAGGVTFTSEPAAPTGTQYRIHSIAK